MHVSGRIAVLDALRGLAALAVVVFHFGWRVGWDNWGNAGVPVFFVLSGYVIALSIGSRRIDLGFIARFALRRELRLAPPYWISIVGMVIVGILSAHIGFTPKPVTVEQTWWHLFYLQEWLGFEHIQVVYWTLCYEIQFYLGLLLLLWILRGADAAMVVMAATAVMSLCYRTWQPEAEAFMGNAWFCFSLGVMACWAGQSRGESTFLTMAGLTAVVGALRPDAYALSASATALLLHLAVSSGRAHLGSHPALQFLGRISYSLYLTHLVGGWVVLGLARHIVSDGAAIVIAVAASVACAWLFHVLIEAPSVRLSRRVPLEAPPPRPVPA